MGIGCLLIIMGMGWCGSSLLLLFWVVRFGLLVNMVFVLIMIVLFVVCFLCMCW